ncbi:DUF1127 domain-containing protein [Flavimaricola marinus]|uniref:DUF1127 domain-containing protein n=1 Tax=Flavimaricola marinus TaxID=1819565 RepID=A0A238LDS0_9RHOB|nr:DUF1127 domain-containing protein [Flavimaricola marinus]SMY07080.1 hypothetical protein LOM8899_01212 [Flavimaricola marinus]
MAHAIPNNDFYPKVDVLSRIGNWFSATIVSIAENNPRMRRVHTLQAMSDAQLAALGIKRDDIVHLVFRDVYYT